MENSNKLSFDLKNVKKESDLEKRDYAKITDLLRDNGIIFSHHMTPDYVDKFKHVITFEFSGTVSDNIKIAEDMLDYFLVKKGIEI
jgi:hypothetical protein